MTDVDRAILDAWEKIRPLLQSNPDELQTRLARRRQTMLRRPMRHCCLALRASDRRINAYHWIITPSHAMDLDHEDHPYHPIEHEVLIQTPQLRKFYRPFRLDRLGEEATDIAREMGCSPSNLYRARRQNFYVERYVSHLAGKRGKPVPILHQDRPLLPGGGHFFQPPHPILGAAWSWLTDLLPDDFEQPITRIPVFRRNPAGMRPPDDEEYTDDSHFTAYRWLCPSCKKPARKIYYPIPMRLISGFLTPDPAKELTHISDADSLYDFPQSFACAKCHRILHFDAIYPCGWNNLISHMTAGLL